MDLYRFIYVVYNTSSTILVLLEPLFKIVSLILSRFSRLSSPSQFNMPAELHLQLTILPIIN